MFRILLIIAICTVAFFGEETAAQEVEIEPELRAPTVVVQGVQQKQAEIYVSLLMPKSGVAQARGVPRWNSVLCTSVIGPPIEQAQFMADRVTRRAIEAGVQTGAPGCSTNFLVIVTNDPEVLLPAIADKHRAVFGFTGDANIDTGGSDISLASFMASSRPVRWRQVVETVGADGMPIDGDARADGLKFGQPDLTNLPVVRADSTRLRSNVRRQLSRVVIVVDTRQTSGLSLAAISDYVAFVALADVSADADLAAFPSILNLFNPEAEQLSEMSDWDLAFLKGLYSARLTGANGTMQYREIAAQMVKD
ncbi:MAG: hypothetical protein ACK4P2_04210 [Hyphomonas sp.]